MKTVVCKIGNLKGAILPKDVLERLGISEGDLLDIVETPDGLHLSKSKSDMAEQMRTAKEFMHSFNDALSLAED